MLVCSSRLILDGSNLNRATLYSCVLGVVLKYWFESDVHVISVHFFL